MDTDTTTTETATIVEDIATTVEEVKEELLTLGEHSVKYSELTEMAANLDFPPTKRGRGRGRAW